MLVACGTRQLVLLSGLIPLAGGFFVTAPGALEVSRSPRLKVHRTSCAMTAESDLFSDAPATLLSEVGREARDRPGQR